MMKKFLKEIDFRIIDRMLKQEQLEILKKKSSRQNSLILIIITKILFVEKKKFGEHFFDRC
jgi:hypothetical protein